MNPERSMESDDNEDNNGSNVEALGASNDGKTGRSCPQSNICEKDVRNVSLDHVSVQQYAQRVANLMQPVFGSKDCDTSLASGVAKEPISATMERHSKVGPSQLGKRRRLQFETTQEKSVENHPGFQNPSEFLDSCADIPSTHDIQLTGSTQSTCSLSLSQNTNNNRSTVSKPSGIGLHLNSIVKARPLANISIKSTEGSKKMSISINSHIHDNIQCPLISSNSNLVETVSARSEEYTHETSYGNATSKEINEYLEKFDQGSLNSEQAKEVDELDRSNPKKRRKKTARTGDGCKHCNCKKSKCLKLYCDCFTAGIYCADPCSCQGCFNKPEHENTVLETRQRIESRNPLAFAPKIFHRLTQPPRSQTVEDGNQSTPLAGRHKKGCNCKKSMCLKKYCECYEENVGCSDGCRCEGCQNIYGKKGVSSMVREMGMEAFDEKLNDSYDDKLKVGSIRLRSSLPEFQKPDNLTPQTPTFQCSNHGKAASKALVFPRRYIASPESECTFYPPYVTTPQSPITEASNKNHEMVHYEQESYPSIEFMDEFSPGCTTTSMNEWSHNLRAQLLPPSGVNFSSLRFGGSSVTPVTLFGGEKLSDSQQKSIDIIDDDTPKILRDSSIEPGKVKVTSPNKKRISPPRIRLHELGSSTLKSGRKFILKAVPSVPPRTPCIDSKDYTGQNSDDPPHDSTL